MNGRRGQLPEIELCGGEVDSGIEAERQLVVGKRIDKPRSLAAMLGSVVPCPTTSARVG